MKKKTIKKKSPRKKGATKTKKKVLEKTARDKKIEEQQPWIDELNFPLDYRNQFPTDIQEIDNYIAFLKENATKYEVELNAHDELDMFQAYRWGWAVGWSEGIEAVMNRIKEVRNDTQIQKNLEHEERDKEEFDRQTRNQFIKNYLEEKKATGDPIHTTEDNAQFKVEDDNEEINNRFNEWWRTTQDPEYKTQFQSMTFDDLDKYECISFGAYLNISFEDFDKFVKKYCWSRRRVGFWRVNEWGTQTFHFDVTNEEELQEHSKDFKIRQAKRLLEEEGIIEPNDKEELQEPPEPDYSKGI